MSFDHRLDLLELQVAMLKKQVKWLMAEVESPTIPDSSDLDSIAVGGSGIVGNSDSGTVGDSDMVTETAMVCYNRGQHTSPGNEEAVEATPKEVSPGMFRNGRRTGIFLAPAPTGEWQWRFHFREGSGTITADGEYIYDTCTGNNV